MAIERTCPQCGTMLSSDALEGLCPTCVGRAAFASAGAEAITPEIKAEFERLKPEEAGERIGQYKLMEQIGQGGFGTVWVADQEKPVRRRVALKIIKLGMDTKEVIARFEQERQALAMMDHPHIAKVFDAGATQWGRPYFVMELVRGIKFTDYCDQANLPTADRLALFIQVCQAVQHAHQKGIIHRDLKPSNILVTLHDGVPVPKVIDFGVAKATQGRLADQTVYTQFQQMIGTPLYMSPEQAEMSSLDIDTRSDIYSLGVLLYELLTGRTPFDPEELMRKGHDEIRRAIREQEPQTPSMFVSTMEGESRMRTAQRHQTESAKLVALLRGDLDWIVMKALEKDRARRYETANGLALDIQRHLHNEPVLARPPSRLYRFQRTVQRNKFAFAAGTLVAAALLLAVVVLIVSRAGILAERNQTETARHAEHAANRDLHESNTRLADTVGLLELERAESFFRDGDAGLGVAHLAATLRREPTNRIAASRLVSALIHRNWALQDSPPLAHLERVVTASFSPDGENVLTASWDGSARIRAVSSGESIVTVRHAGVVNSARYNPAGTAFVTASADGTARIWNAETSEPLTPPLRHGGNVFDAEFSPDGESVLTASAASAARIWSAHSGDLKFEFQTGSEVRCAHFSPDGRRMAMGSSTGTVRICDAASGKELFQRKAPFGAVNGLAFSHNGRRLIIAHDGGSAVLLSPDTGEPICPPLLHDSRVWCGVFNPISMYLVTTSEDGAVRVWDGETGRPVAPAYFQRGAVRFAAFWPNGAAVATTCMDNTVRFWTGFGPPATLYCQPLREREQVYHVAFSLNHRRLVTASASGRAQVWDIRYRAAHVREFREEKAVWTVVFGPRGETLLVASANGAAQLWNPRTGEPAGVPIAHGAAMREADLSADGKYIATAGDDGMARIWNAATGQTIGEPLQHAQRVRMIHFSPDETRVVTASYDGTARVWETLSGKAVTPPLEHASQVWCARFSPDGRLVVTASKDGSARVWDAATGQAVSPPLMHLDHVEWADFSPDSTRVVTASSDNTARMWEARTGQAIGLPLRHLRTVPKAIFSPDGRRVLTVSIDRTARLWDANTGAPLTGPLEHDDSLTRGCFSPDGARILTATWGKHARIWDAVTGRPLTEWLETGGRITTSACFDPTGQRIATATEDHVARVWEFPPVPESVPGWFLTFAEALAGIRLDTHGNVEMAPQQDWIETTGQVRRSQESGYYERVARWFLDDPITRPLDPF